MAARAAFALGCRVNPVSIFARKNYFYPDLPKGYQISQYDRPLADQGVVELEIDESEGKKEPQFLRFRINRIHLEDDAGKSIHDAGPMTLVNLNRTGTPLIEIVTEADFRSSHQASEFLTFLRKVLVYLGVCDGNMEEGSLRCDANVSIRPSGTEPFGTKAEIKNLNSIRFLRKALDYEIERQIHEVTAGGRIRQETRLWDEESGTTRPMRSKEEAHDYRYFPEPDLLPVVIDDAWMAELRAALPELPEARRKRFREQFGLDGEAASMMVQSRAFGDYFEAAVARVNQPLKIANWMIGDLTRMLKLDDRDISECPVSPAHLAALVELVESGAISGKSAKEVFARAYETGEDPRRVVDALGLRQISSSGELEAVIDRILAANPKEVQAYRGGKQGLMGFFVGQVMRETRGQANPSLVNQILTSKLKADS